MKTNELITLVNNNNFKTLTDFEEYKQKNQLNITTVSIHQNKRLCEGHTKTIKRLHVINETATNVYKCEDGYVGIEGLTFTENTTTNNKKCTAKEFIAIPRIEYVSIEQAKTNFTVKNNKNNYNTTTQQNITQANNITTDSQIFSDF